MRLLESCEGGGAIDTRDATETARKAGLRRQCGAIRWNGALKGMDGWICHAGILTDHDGMQVAAIMSQSALHRPDRSPCNCIAIRHYDITTYEQTNGNNGGNLDDSKKPGAPDFSEPIAALKHCHERIRRELRGLESLHAHLASAGADAQARQDATAVLQYFEQAAPIHHADEEEDLIPLLQSAARDADAALLKLMVPVLMNEHREMALVWEGLRSALQQIAAGADTRLDLGAVKHFSLLYAVHMDTEETHIATMARRVLDPARMQLLGNAMRRRRGIAPADAPATGV